MKAIALGLLLAAAVVYIVATVAGPDGWVGYVQAFAEAAMVGALADWFAVTALFRHPLGLKIPHTAIIPTRKDQIGRSLGEFVESNFLTRDVLDERLAEVNTGEHLGMWLMEPANAQKVSGAVGDALRGVLEVLDDREVQHGIEGLVRDRIANIPAAPLVGRAVDLTVGGGHHQRLLDAVLVGMGNVLDDNREAFQKRLYEESPWFVPESVDNKVLEKIYDVLGRFVADVRSDPNHEMRTAVDARIEPLAQSLKNDPAMIAKGEALKAELLDLPEFRAWIETLWLGTKSAMINAAEDPESDLRIRAAASLEQLGARLMVEPELQQKVDDWVRRAAGFAVERYSGQAGDLIASTVERWDGESLSRRTELQVGRDLQFIRINGTLVGGVAGVVIHALAEVL